MKLLFDIETEPLPSDQLAAVMPEFTAAKNLKDPEKIKADIEGKKQSWIDDAALSALTGRVLAIGVVPMWESDGPRILSNDDEKLLLIEFWNLCRSRLPDAIPTLIGFNSHGFDLPFLIRRSWKHKIEIPAWYRNGRWWSDRTIDLQEIWQLGDRFSAGGLGSVCKCLGIGSKDGHGRAFAALWRDDRPQAEQYLYHDLKLLLMLSERLGVISA